MTEPKFYAERDIDELGEHYYKHVSAMTTERLHSKSAIASELAFRDLLIEQQAAEIAILSQQNPNGDRNPSPGDPCGRSCEGTAYRIELRHALDQVEQQAKQIEALRALLNDIKLFEVDSGVERMKKGEPAFAMPVELRKRIQSALTGE